jgi:hypothetical protein
VLVLDDACSPVRRSLVVGRESYPCRGTPSISPPRSTGSSENRNRHRSEQGLAWHASIGAGRHTTVYGRGIQRCMMYRNACHCQTFNVSLPGLRHVDGRRDGRAFYGRPPISAAKVGRGGRPPTSGSQPWRRQITSRSQAWHAESVGGIDLAEGLPQDLVESADVPRRPDWAKTMCGRRGNTPGTPLALPVRRAPMRVLGPRPGVDGRVSWWVAQDVIGERQPGAQAVIRRLEHMFGRIGEGSDGSTGPQPRSPPRPRAGRLRRRRACCGCRTRPREPRPVATGLG